jgi:hypothetical protein
MTDSKQVPTTAKRKPPAAGKGRPKGTPNKTTAQLKEMILQALDQAGGVAYLVKQAKRRNPAPFMALLGKVLPMQVTGADGGPIEASLKVTFTKPEPKDGANGG